MASRSFASLRFIGVGRSGQRERRAEGGSSSPQPAKAGAAPRLLPRLIFSEKRPIATYALVGSAAAAFFPFFPRGAGGGHPACTAHRVTRNHKKHNTQCLAVPRRAGLRCASLHTASYHVLSEFAPAPALLSRRLLPAPTPSPHRRGRPRRKSQWHPAGTSSDQSDTDRDRTTPTRNMHSASYTQGNQFAREQRRRLASGDSPTAHSRARFASPAGSPSIAAGRSALCTDASHRLCE